MNKGLFIFILLPLLMVMLEGSLFRPSSAQPVLNRQSVSMGGGAAYQTGPAAGFYNPANLMLRDHQRRNRVVLGQAAFFFSDGMTPSELFEDYRNFGNSFSRYLPSSDAEPAFESGSDNRFGRNGNRYTQTTRFDVITFGISFTRDNHAFSIALRTRSDNTFEINSGWFEQAHAGSPEQREQILKHNISTFHEISFGFAREVTMVNGWIPGLNRLYFGMAPKLIVGGLYFDGNYSSEFFRDDQNSQTRNITRYRSRGTGLPAQTWQNGPELSQAALSLIDPDHTLLQPKGFGAGMDAGLTYIINLDDDLSQWQQPGNPLRKSLRISASLTDIGLVSYHENNSYRSFSDTVTTSGPSSSDRHFTGQIGEFNAFLAASSDDPGRFYTQPLNRDRFHIPLPAALHAGLALQYNRLLIGVDYEYRLLGSSFTGNTQRMTAGSEIRVLRYFLLRSGIHYNAAYGSRIGLGMSLDFGLWELSLDSQFRQGFTDDIYSVGLAIGALQIRI